MDDLFVRLRYYIGLLVPFLYIIMGVYVMIEKIFIVKIEPIYAYSLGLILVLYGLFRIYRVFKHLKKEK